MMRRPCLSTSTIAFLVSFFLLHFRVAKITAFVSPVDVSASVIRKAFSRNNRFALSPCRRAGKIDADSYSVIFDDNDNGDSSRNKALTRAKEKQIERATQHLDEQLEKLLAGGGALPDENNLRSIRAALDQGIVKPAFHALFLPQTFLGKPLSFDPVTAGQVDENQIVKLEEDANNLDEVVAKRNILFFRFGDELGAGKIFDKYLGDSWDFSRNQAAFAAELVNADAKMLGEDVESTILSTIPTKMSDGEESNALFTRPESRGVVSDIFHKFETKSRVGSISAITGSPGIGKSWTLFYALQQALLYDGANVLFFFQKRSIAVMYLRRNNKIYAWSARSVEANSNLFSRLDVIVLLDPREANDQGAKFSTGQMKLLYAASNNEAHFKNSALKDFEDVLSFLGPPTDKELYVILGRIDPSLQPVQIEERKKNIGNLIRYILIEKKYIEREKVTDDQAKACLANPTLLEQVLRKEGMSDVQLNVPGLLFAVMPTRPYEVATIGYEGENINYRERKIAPANDAVLEAVFKHGRQPILSFWGKVDQRAFADMGLRVEELFISDLLNADGMVMERYLQSEDSPQTESSKLVVEKGMTQLRNVEFSKVCDEVLLKPNVVAECKEKTALIDAAGPKRRVYQITVADKHDVRLDFLTKLCQSLGYIDKEGNLSSQPDEVEKLEFYWVVPPGSKTTWINKAPFSYTIQDAEPIIEPSKEILAETTKEIEARKKKDADAKKRKVANEVLRMYVNQYVLPMTEEPPMTWSQWEKEEIQRKTATPNSPAGSS